jgi:hypothetical protein
VAFQADAVPGAVDEPVAVPGGGDDAARHPVHLLRLDAGPGRVAGLVLRVLEHRVVLREVGGRLADRVGPRAVRAVSRRHRAADVDDHDVALLHHPVGDLVVRAGGVRP